MTAKLNIEIGRDIEAIDREIVARVNAAEAAARRGEAIQASRTIRFESWRGFFRAMSANRMAILEYVSDHDGVPSTRALAKALDRDYAAVHADVAELLKLGLLERDGNALRCDVEPGSASLGRVEVA